MQGNHQCYNVSQRYASDNAMRLYFDFLIKMHKQYDRWHIYMNDKKEVEYEYGLTLHEL